MLRISATIAFVSMLVACFNVTYAADDEGHHVAPNHIALIAGVAFEEQADGHRENGNVVGIEYIRHMNERWRLGASFELEAFGDNHKRHGVLAFPVSYFVNHRWRLFGAPGIEFREQGEPDKVMFRLGTGYEFLLGEHWSLSPEAQIDFIAGGTNVYVFALALGYGF
jgi:hypothetical protein